jgi:phosphopantetheinyl transferase
MSGLSVQTMSPIHRRGPVFYASMLLQGPVAPGGRRINGGAKEHLVSLLWDHVRAIKIPNFPIQDDDPIQVVHDPLGKPLFLRGERRGPAVSFSEGGGRLWAALCGDESDIGIDVAGADEFPRGYPIHRAFHTPELQQAIMLAGGDASGAAALLWSIKEAVVKALGCAFHLVDPRDIDVRPSHEGGGYAFSAYLSKRTLARFPIIAGRPIWVRSLPQLNRWLSIAVLNGRHP